MLPILSWYDQVRRDLPWRESCDPYRVWVSEIMLQQTTTAAVIPYFLRWMERFPTVAALASAEEQEVLAAWQGLGYYRRARLLHAGAKRVAEAGWPTDVAGWLKVPGVGKYTAGAIASIAFGEPAPLVDGNVERVYARVCGDDSQGTKLKENAWRWAAANVPSERAGDYNQALMELGATVCTPRAPRCGECPVRDLCEACRVHRQEELPRKAEKDPVIRLDHWCWIPFRGSAVGLRQIPRGEWWEGLWEFPRRTTPDPPDWAKTPRQAGIVRHTVTKHRISLHVAWVEGADVDDLSWFALEAIEDLPMPSPQRKALAMVLKFRSDR